MNTTALAVTVNNLDDLRTVAQLLAMSGYFDAKGSTEQAISQIATKILAGQELGYGPFASVQGIHVIQGKPAMSANLMAAAVKASARYDYRVRQMDDSAVSIEFFERIAGKLESIGVSTFTAQDAQKAGTQNMQKYGRNMMFSRAMSNGVKWYCPDVFSGNTMYTPEEMGAQVNGEGEYIETTYTVTPPAAQPSPEPATPAQSPTPAPQNGNGTGAAHVELPPEVRMWESPQDAYDWAIGIGASENVHSARAAFTNAAKAHGGKLTKSNAPAVYLDFYTERMARAKEKLAQPLDIDMATLPEMNPDGPAPAELFA